MLSLMTVSEAQKKLVHNIREQRLSMGFTQAGLAKRSGVPLPSLRKFEQGGGISLESFLKLLMVLGAIESVVEATKPLEKEFSSIDEVLESKKKTRKKGWRT